MGIPGIFFRVFPHFKRRTNNDKEKNSEKNII